MTKKELEQINAEAFDLLQECKKEIEENRLIISYQDEIDELKTELLNLYRIIAE